MSEAARRIAPSGSPESRSRAIAPQASPADAAVIEALRRGEEEAFTLLVDRLHETLRRVARLYVSTPAVADEVVQDTWLAVIEGVWAFEGRSALRTWILRILINQARTRARREGRMVPFAEAGVEDSEPPTVDAGESPGGHSGDGGYGGHRADSPETWLLTQEARVRIREAIDALPASQRIVITMRDLEGCSSQEVCNVLGLSETNQRVLLHRARTGVRVVLAPYLRKV